MGFCPGCADLKHSQRTVMAQIVGGQVDGAAKARELASKYRKMNKYSPSRLPTNA